MSSTSKSAMLPCPFGQDRRASAGFIFHVLPLSVKHALRCSTANSGGCSNRRPRDANVD